MSTGETRNIAFEWGPKMWFSKPIDWRSSTGQHVVQFPLGRWLERSNGRHWTCNRVTGLCVRAPVRVSCMPMSRLAPVRLLTSTIHGLSGQDGGLRHSRNGACLCGREMPSCPSRHTCVNYR